MESIGLKPSIQPTVGWGQRVGVAGGGRPLQGHVEHGLERQHDLRPGLSMQGRIVARVLRAHLFIYTIIHSTL